MVSVHVRCVRCVRVIGDSGECACEVCEVCEGEVGRRRGEIPVRSEIGVG